MVGSSAEELPCSSQLHVPMQAMLGAPAAPVVAPHQLLPLQAATSSGPQMLPGLQLPPSLLPAMSLPSGSSSLQAQMALGQGGPAVSTPALQSVLSSMHVAPAPALGAAQPLAAPLTEQQCQQLLLWQSQQWQLHQLQQLCLLQSSAAQQHQAAQQQHQLLFQQPGQQLATAVVADEGAPQRLHQQQGQSPREAAVAALQQHFQVPAAQQERFCRLCLRLQAVIEVYTPKDCSMLG